MFFTVRAIALLCWMSALSHSAPLACEDLVRPLDQLDPHHLEGRWALVAGSLSHPPYLEKFKQRDSASVIFSTNDTNIYYTRSIRVDNKCQYNTYNISLEGSSVSYDGTDKRNFSATLVHTTCRDCLLMRFDVESGKRLHFYLFSRRRELEQSEMEEFRAQAECLKMPPPVVMDPTKELCPDETAGDPAAQTEERTVAEGQND